MKSTDDFCLSREPVGGTTEDTIKTWVLSQLAYWIGCRPSLHHALASFERLNSERPDVFRFDVRAGDALIAPKETARDGTFDEHIKRAKAYETFLRNVARRYCPHVECSLIMSMHDGASEHSEIPFFAFQKTVGSHAILLPDIDALNNNFYEGRYDDGVAYEHKQNRAIFVGATTGSLHTLKSVNCLENDRLKLGVFFRNYREVDFRLPFITQCDSPETEDAIRALGFGVGWASWAEQLQSRFLISIDGNGATCSRVVISLKSNSVLLKYKSHNLLHYFSGLREFGNYIPIYEGQDILKIIKAERENPGLFRPIAENGAAFYREFLTEHPSMHYTALLLQGYSRIFVDQSALWNTLDSCGDLQSASPSGEFAAGECLVHVANRGDILKNLNSWIGDDDRREAIEGFALTPTSLIELGSLAYTAYFPAPEPPETKLASEFVGSRNQSRPILGIAFHLIGATAMRYQCIYVCYFVNGSMSNICRDDEVCQSESGAPISCFQIRITPRNDASTVQTD